MRRKLSALEKRARERFRLIEPETAYKVVGHPRYWSIELLKILFAYVDDLAGDEPERAAAVAEHLPVLVERIRVDDGDDSFPNEIAKRSELARAHVVRLYCARLLGRRDVDRDRLPLQRLFEQGVTRDVAVEYYRRQALYRLESHPEEAVKAVERAVEECDATMPLLLGEVLLLRALVRHRLLNASAADDLGAAIELADRTPRGRRLLDDATTALQYDLARFTARLSMLDASARSLKRTRTALAGQPRSAAKLRLLALSGTIHSMIGLDRHAARSFRRARRGFLMLGSAPIDHAVTSIDYYRALRSNDQDAAAREVPRKLVTELEAMEAPPSLLDTIAAWLVHRVPDVQQLQTLKIRCCSLRLERA